MFSLQKFVQEYAPRQRTCAAAFEISAYSMTYPRRALPDLAKISSPVAAQESGADFNNYWNRRAKDFSGNQRRISHRAAFPKGLPKLIKPRLQNSASLCLRWFRNNPQHSVPLLLLALYFGIWTVVLPRRQKSAPVPLPAPVITPLALSAAPAPLLKSGVPAFVNALGLKPGRSTERDLERKIGAGEVCIGGHSNSGREWFFRNGLVLYADGFDGDGRGDSLFIDSLVFKNWNGPLGETLELKKYGFGLWGKLRVGMSQAECLQILPGSTPTLTTTQDEITWEQRGLGRRYEKKATFVYDAILRFSGGKLECLLIECYALDN